MKGCKSYKGYKNFQTWKLQDEFFQYLKPKEFVEEGMLRIVAQEMLVEDIPDATAASIVELFLDEVDWDTLTEEMNSRLNRH